MSLADQVDIEHIVKVSFQQVMPWQHYDICEACELQ